MVSDGARAVFQLTIAPKPVAILITSCEVSFVPSVGLFEFCRRLHQIAPKMIIFKRSYCISLNHHVQVH